MAAFDAVKSAQEAALTTIASGRPTGEVDRAARETLRAAGYDHQQFLHVTGHGIGMKYHEPIPLIMPDGADRLERGMVHTVEPGVYVPGLGGFRIEDNVVVTQSGHELLGPFEKTLVT
jgi:Xaa-Pro aminopeptidase